MDTSFLDHLEKRLYFYTALVNTTYGAITVRRHSFGNKKFAVHRVDTACTNYTLSEPCAIELYDIAHNNLFCANCCSELKSISLYIEAVFSVYFILRKNLRSPKNDRVSFLEAVAFSALADQWRLDRTPSPILPESVREVVEAFVKEMRTLLIETVMDPSLRRTISAEYTPSPEDPEVWLIIDMPKWYGQGKFAYTLSYANGYTILYPYLRAEHRGVMQFKVPQTTANIFEENSVLLRSSREVSAEVIDTALIFMKDSILFPDAVRAAVAV